MSGLRYEVRAASVNADGQSEWSSPVLITAPELLPAPADAIALQIQTLPPLLTGEGVEVHIHRAWPIARRSLYVWSLCDPDGSDCEALFYPGRWSYRLESIPNRGHGKVLRVQVDYDKDGASYTAQSALGLVNPRWSEFGRPLPPPLPPRCEAMTRSSGDDEVKLDGRGRMLTHLHILGTLSVRVEWDEARGGAIEALCDGALVVTPWGRMAFARPDGSMETVEGQVPMNLERRRSQNLDSEAFRVADILLKQRSEGVWELFATHHYFTGDCVRFRLSSTTLLLEDGRLSASPSWRTLFDAEPCLQEAADAAGGRMLTDGPDHLLIVTGSHHLLELSESHLGKLVRVSIETGDAEILALGLRNPQGFARDADGALWATDHGPIGGDELNLLEPGLDYGWPSVSYGVRNSSRDLFGDEETAGEHSGFALPVFSWVPSVPVSTLIVNDERWFPLWKDDLLIGVLGGESYGQSILRVRRVGDKVQYVERIALGYRVRDLTQLADGGVAALDDDGRVHFLAMYCNDYLIRLPVYDVGCRRAYAAHPPDADGAG